MKIVLDACAAIAFFKDESGAGVIEQYLVESQYECMMHSVNLCEVYYDFCRSNGEAFAENVISQLQIADVRFRSDLTEDFWRQVGRYKLQSSEFRNCSTWGLTRRRKSLK